MNHFKNHRRKLTKSFNVRGYEKSVHSDGDTASLTSSSGILRELKIQGKTEQKQYQGYNLLDINNPIVAGSTGYEVIDNSSIVFTPTQNYATFKYLIKVEIGKQYTVSLEDAFNTITTNSALNRLMISNTTNQDSAEYGYVKKDEPLTFTATSEDLYIKGYACYTYNEGQVSTVIKPMVVEGGEVKEYEEYFGGASSPNDRFPQKITHTENVCGLSGINLAYVGTPYKSYQYAKYEKITENDFYLIPTNKTTSSSKYVYFKYQVKRNTYYRVKANLTRIGNFNGNSQVLCFRDGNSYINGSSNIVASTNHNYNMAVNSGDSDTLTVGFFIMSNVVIGEENDIKLLVEDFSITEGKDEKPYEPYVQHLEINWDCTLMGIDGYNDILTVDCAEKSIKLNKKVNSVYIKDLHPGDMTVTESNGYYGVEIRNLTQWRVGTKAYCTHCKMYDSENYVSGQMCFELTSDGHLSTLYFYNTESATVDEFIAYASESNLMIAYVMESEENTELEYNLSSEILPYNATAVIEAENTNGIDVIYYSLQE